MLICLLLITTCACKGNVSNVEIESYESTMYEDSDVEAAIEVVKEYFKENFEGCKLTSITYAGDEVTQNHIEVAKRHNADEVLVLSSSFETGSSLAIGDSGLNDNHTYVKWLWILVRTEDGEWQHADHGY